MLASTSSVFICAVRTSGTNSVIALPAVCSRSDHGLHSRRKCAANLWTSSGNRTISSSSRRPAGTLPRSLPPHVTTEKSRMISSRHFEEERLPHYDPEQFYPVRLGDVIQARYRVIGKLGFGANSTVWFCRNLQNDSYVTLKVYVRTPAGRINREKAMYEHLDILTSTHSGCHNIRPVLDMFELVRPSGDTHVCLVHPPLQTTLFDFQRLSGRPRPLPEALVKTIMRNLLEALDFLHTEAIMAHCDLKLSNIMLQVDDKSVFQDFEQAEAQNPSEQKFIGQDRTIYASRNFRPPKANAYGLPILCDFGEARIGSPQPYTEIQPASYKAPEILMQFEWGPAVDIWNAGCLMWEMLEVERLFDGSDSEGFHNNRYHMNEIVSLLGLPPKAFLSRSPHAGRLFDESRNWIADPPVKALPLESRARHISEESKAVIIDFLQSMLCWQPEERKSAKELLAHPCLSEASDYDS